MIRLVYQHNDIVDVSIHSLYKISKYRRADSGEQPRLSVLGSGAWERLKEKTKKRIKDIARDLIKLYAKRRHDKGFALLVRLLYAARAGSVFPLRRHARPAESNARDEARHGKRTPDGPSHLRRCGLRKDRSGSASGLQSCLRRQAGGSARADNGACFSTFPDVQEAAERYAGKSGLSLACPFGEADERGFGRLGRGENRYPRRHTQAHRQKRKVERHRATHHRRGTEVRRIDQREAAPTEIEHRYAHHVGDTHPPNAPILTDGRKGHEHHAYPATQPLSDTDRDTHASDMRSSPMPSTSR